MTASRLEAFSSMASESELVCGMPVVAAFYGACFMTLVSLCLSLAGLCAAEFAIPARWRFAIGSGVLSVVVGSAVALLFYDSPIGGAIPSMFAVVALVIGILTILAGIARRPRSTAGD
ncbi:MAG: hypothetical protein DWQ31_14960 [Planctomycetota bacterium]|nr:MAG: hypothetical protein DWQ31_14960 [Planctomycetota bacterium]REJ96208.1 MAG: hypothetical protein DWQ35_05070 [Planctomycetota bacterium]REK29364.1 MAG: hypothetical protein DWQ42_03810 [Planctomycetota bacterium]